MATITHNDNGTITVSITLELQGSLIEMENAILDATNEIGCLATNLLKEKLPSIHAARLRALMAAVEAGLSGASVSITALGRALSGPAYIKHKIKRLDRLAENCHLNTERMALYGAMTQWLLQSLPMPLILIYWSPLTADQHQQLLRAALPT